MDELGSPVGNVGSEFKPEKHRLGEVDPGKRPLRMSRVGG